MSHVLNLYEELFKNESDQSIIKAFGQSDEVLDDSFVNPLIAAIRLGRFSLVEGLVKSGADPRRIYPGHTSVLAEAVESSHSEHNLILSYLLSFYPVFDKNNYWEYRIGMLPLLHYAVWRGDNDCVALLVQHGAGIDWLDENGETARNNKGGDS